MKDDQPICPVPSQPIRLSYSNIPVLPLSHLPAALQQPIFHSIMVSPLPLVIFLHLNKECWFRVGLQCEPSSSSSQSSSVMTTFPMNSVQLQLSPEYTDVVVTKQVSATWQCSVCLSHLFLNNLLEIASHIRTHMEKSFCFFCFELLSTDREHECSSECHRLSCMRCGEVCHSAASLYEHLCSEHYCDYAQTRPRAAETQLANKGPGTSGIKEQFDCRLCGKSFESLYKCNKHMRVVHPSVHHQCSLCSSTFKTATNLRIHMKEIHGGDPPQFTCDICHKTFRQKRNFVRHQNTVHQEKPPVTESFSILYYETTEMVRNTQVPVPRPVNTLPK